MGGSYLTELEREQGRERERERESEECVCERMHYVQEEPLEFQRETTMTMSNISLLIASARLSALDASDSASDSASAASSSCCCDCSEQHSRLFCFGS